MYWPTEAFRGPATQIGFVIHGSSYSKLAVWGVILEYQTSVILNVSPVIVDVNMPI